MKEEKMWDIINRYGRNMWLAGFFIGIGLGITIGWLLSKLGG